jgi:protein-L-isoaspartate(D-aspartate) O-methyltransferase
VPAHRLITLTCLGQEGNVNAADMKTIQAGALAILAGASDAEAAARLSVSADVLLAAARVYRAAGHAAVEDWASQSGWHQVRIDFADWRTAEKVAVTRLDPALTQAVAGGILARWFFTRKAASWRLRCQGMTGDAGKSAEEPAGILAHALDEMAQRGDIIRWSTTIYEMETHAFGGSAGMELAHQLFHTDSAAILGHLADTQTRALIHSNRAELSILLCSLLLRGAGLDWYEQGDVWARVSTHRALSPAAGRGHPRARRALRRLLTADTGPGSVLINNGPLARCKDWAAAFDHTGRILRRLSDDGTLDRGLRAVLAHHILFHWNRVGLPSDTQGALAALAHDLVMTDGGGDAVSIPSADAVGH